MHLKIPHLSGGWKLSYFKAGCRVSALHFLWKRHHQWLPGIELGQISASPASYSRMNPCLAAWKQIGVLNCHATRRHRDYDHLHVCSLYGGTPGYTAVHHHQDALTIMQSREKNMLKGHEIAPDHREPGTYMSTVVPGVRQSFHVTNTSDWESSRSRDSASITASLVYYNISCKNAPLSRWVAGPEHISRQGFFVFPACTWTWFVTTPAV
jgi:hypothetical protein